MRMLSLPPVGQGYRAVCVSLCIWRPTVCMRFITMKVSCDQEQLKMAQICNDQN